MARKLCIDCGVRGAKPDTPEGQMCHPCYDYAGMENEHDDDDHEGVLDGSVTWGMTTHKTRKEFNAWMADRREETKTCPVCHPELDPRNRPVRKGHTNTVAHTRTSHADHYHPRTPEARAACRKLTRAGKAPLDQRTKK